MIKDKLYTKYKFTKIELKIIENCFKIRPENVEHYLDAITPFEREKFFYKIQAKFLELINKKM